MVTTLTIIGGVGDVTITAWERTEHVEVEYIKIAYADTEDRARGELDDVIFRFTNENDALVINTTQPASDTRANRVDLVLHVPPTIGLDISVTTGDVDVTGVRAPERFHVSSVSGDVRLTEVDAPDGLAVEAQGGSATFNGSIGAAGA